MNLQFSVPEKLAINLVEYGETKGDAFAHPLMGNDQQFRTIEQILPEDAKDQKLAIGLIAMWAFMAGEKYAKEQCKNCQSELSLSRACRGVEVKGCPFDEELKQS